MRAARLLAVVPGPHGLGLVSGQGRLHLHTMYQPSSATKPLLLICLLIFQAQVLALSWLPCPHADQPETIAGCPSHASHPPAPDTDPNIRQDCAKCTLAVAIGTLHAPPFAPIQAVQPPRLADWPSLDPIHTQRFLAPELRPPQPGSV